MHVSMTGAAALILATVGALPVAAQSAPAPAARQAPPLPAQPLAVPRTAPRTQPRTLPRTILFIGNSFTQGAHSAVRNWRADTVTDLNRTGYGGVPALFKRFTQQVGLTYAVSLETQGGMSLGFHYDQRRQLFDRPWDVVVLQEFSTLDRDRPGDPTAYLRDVGRMTNLFKARNQRAQIWLMATWSRADLIYRQGSRWYGQPIATMADDLQRAASRAHVETPGVTGILPVGKAWNAAFGAGVADPDPYDGITYGQLDLWAYDHYHASVAGYYLEALVVFGRITGVDPLVLGPKETAAEELGLSNAQATALQRAAHDALAQRSASAR